MDVLAAPVGGHETSPAGCLGQCLGHTASGPAHPAPHPRDPRVAIRVGSSVSPVCPPPGILPEELPGMGSISS